MRLTSDADVPRWARRAFIKHGYRPADSGHGVLEWGLSTLFTWHNETFNVFSHLAPAFWLAWISPAVLSGRLHNTAILTSVDVALYSVFLVASASCFIVSACYHLFGPANPATYHRLQVLDMTMILILIGSSFLPPLFVAFSCPQHHTVRAIYITVIIGLVGSMLVLSVVWPLWNTNRMALVRSCTYAVIVLSALVPALHWCILVDCSEALFGLYFLVVGLFIYGLGFMAFVTAVPERIWPGSMVVAFAGSSHNIWHVLTASGVFWTLHATIQYHDYKASHGCQYISN